MTGSHGSRGEVSRSHENVDTCPWVHVVTRDAMGQMERLKAQNAVKRFMQKEGIGLTEMFAPTCAPETTKILKIGAQSDLVLHQMDVKSSFFNSLLPETL